MQITDKQCVLKAFHQYDFNQVLKTFKDSFYSSEKHFLFDNCGFWMCEIKVFLRNLAIVSDGN